MLTAAGGLLGAEKGPWCCWGLRPAPRKGLRPPTPQRRAGWGQATPSRKLGSGNWNMEPWPHAQAAGQWAKEASAELLQSRSAAQRESKVRQLYSVSQRHGQPQER